MIVSVTPNPAVLILRHEGQEIEAGPAIAGR